MKKLARRYWDSSSFKMAALFTVLLGGCAIMLGYFLYDSSHENFLRETEDIIDIELEHVQVMTSGMNQQSIAEFITMRAKQYDYSSYRYTKQSGDYLAGDITAVPQKIEPLKEGVISFSMKNEKENHLYAAKIHTFSDGSHLLIARNIDNQVQQYNKLKNITKLVMFFMFMVVLVSFIISRFVVTRINNIGSIANKIMDTDDLSARIPLDSKWDDISNLAEILNTLFAELEESLESVRHAGDNIAHDLRTPLTRLRNKIEMTHGKTLSGDEYESLVGEVDQLLSTFNALLRISNLEQGKRHNVFAPTNLSNILEDVVELYIPVAEEKNVTIHADLAAECSINGDHDLLFQAFANLLDNAVKFSDDGGNVSVTLTHTKKHPVIVIADKGIGVPKEDREKVFERFYRTDKSRHHKGTGLGLSLVRQALDIHKANIVLENNNPGLRIFIRF